MNDSPKKDDPLIRALREMLHLDEYAARAEHQSELLADQLTALCNEFLAAGRKSEHKNTFGQVSIALIKVLSSVLAQNEPDNLRGLLKTLRATQRELEYLTIAAHQQLHCMTHHSKEHKS